MFCQLDALRQCLPSSLRRTLAELPESLDETYARIVMDIKKGNRADAYRMLQCLAVAIRPLTVAELAELLAFDFDATKGGILELNPKWRWEDHEQAVLSTCSSLITIVPADDFQVVQFSHFSVKEFLLSDRLATSSKDISQYHIVLEDADTLIARACLGVLLRDPVDENGVATTPFAQYATVYWVDHAEVGNVASRIHNGMASLFDPDRPYFSAWVRLYNADRRRWLHDSDLERKIQPGAVPLYHAAFIGFHKIVEHLALKYPQYAHAISGGAGTALHSASHAGHVKVVRVLLKCGVGVDSRGNLNSTSLQLASIAGRLDAVQCLLDHGADANLQDNDHRTSLHLAVQGGHPEIVRVLLGHNVDIHSRNEDGLTPLHTIFVYHSSEGDHIQVVRLLLEYGANPNARDNYDRTPLHLASPYLTSSSFLASPFYLDRPFVLEATRILLAHGADIDAEDDEGTTPLQGALAEGQDDMVKLFIEHCSGSLGGIDEPHHSHARSGFSALGIDESHHSDSQSSYSTLTLDSTFFDLCFG